MLKHIHGVDCNHPVILHNDHVDFVMDDEIHHFNGDYCTSHGKIKIVKRNIFAFRDGPLELGHDGHGSNAGYW